MGKLGEILDPLETKQIYGSNTTKIRQTNKSQKTQRTQRSGSFTKGADPGLNTKNTRRETMEKTQGEHKRTLKPTSMITHALDP